MTDASTGLILAGGRGRRMGGVDKGLQIYQGRPLIAHALGALKPLVKDILISANRHIKDYERLGYPVLEDRSDDYQGPLAGLLRGMDAVQGSSLLSIPCDMPRISTAVLSRLEAAYQSGHHDLVMAHDGERLQPLVIMVGIHLRESLRHYLQEGGRRVDTWAGQQVAGIVDCSDCPDIFFNINSLSELSGPSSEKAPIA